MKEFIIRRYTLIAVQGVIQAEGKIIPCESKNMKIEKKGNTK